jgi:hypothetical protein
VQNAKKGLNLSVSQTGDYSSFQKESSIGGVVTELDTKGWLA